MAYDACEGGAQCTSTCTHGWPARGTPARCLMLCVCVYTFAKTAHAARDNFDDDVATAPHAPIYTSHAARVGCGNSRGCAHATCDSQQSAPARISGRLCACALALAQAEQRRTPPHVHIYLLIELDIKQTSLRAAVRVPRTTGPERNA